jgi:hypothetical protein
MNSHWLALDPIPKAEANDDARALPIPAIVDATTLTADSPAPRDTVRLGGSPTCSAPADDHFCMSNETTPILVLIEADEGAHLALQDDAEFEQLPHPLAQRSISGAAQTALEAYGVPSGATTFDAAEVVARVHPLLRHRVF